MRSRNIEKLDADSSATLWIAAGAVLGVVSGIVIAERLSGRPISARGLWLRSQGVAQRALDKWEPLLDAAMAMREAWMSEDENLDDEELDDEELDDEELDDEELDDEELDDEELDENEEDLDEDDDLDAEDPEDELEDEDDEADDAPPAVDERVLEAFCNDPVLAEREIEIEETEPGAILLHGDVHTAREVAHAVTIARGVPGVTGVRQRLRVRDRR
jgi:hypothetical protein